MLFRSKALTFADKGLEKSKNGAKVFADGGKNIAQKGKNKVIDPALRRLSVVEHKIENRIDQIRTPQIPPNTQVTYRKFPNKMEPPRFAPAKNQA